MKDYLVTKKILRLVRFDLVDVFLAIHIVLSFQMLEHDMAVNAENLNEIVDQGKEMARAGHFDSASILKSVENFDRRSVIFTFELINKFYYSFVKRKYLNDDKCCYLTPL